MTSRTFNADDTRIPNNSSESLPDAPSRLQSREYIVILFILDVDPRQSAVTLPSSPGANASYLIVIEIAAFSETEADSGEHVGWDVSYPFHV